MLRREHASRYSASFRPPSAICAGVSLRAVGAVSRPFSIRVCNLAAGPAACWWACAPPPRRIPVCFHGCLAGLPHSRPRPGSPGREQSLSPRSAPGHHNGNSSGYRLRRSGKSRSPGAARAEPPVDECHCVTSWGHGFRPDYLEIGTFIDSLPHKPVVAALTTTAAPDMRLQICELLSMDQPKIFANSLHRPNLHYMKRSFVSDAAKLKELKHLLKKRKSGSCIIFCNTKGMTDDLYDEVKKWYPGNVVKCHSNLAGQVRKGNEMSFLSGECRIMIATSAFGLGVDQSNVDLVIHFNLPLSLIDYYQQAGRAGRAGQKAKCVLLYCEDDYRVNRTLLKSIENKNARKAALRALDKMKEYAESSECLTRQILSALGEEMKKPCGSCTNCQKARKK